VAYLVVTFLVDQSDPVTSWKNFLDSFVFA